MPGEPTAGGNCWGTHRANGNTILGAVPGCSSRQRRRRTAHGNCQHPDRSQRLGRCDQHCRAARPASYYPRRYALSELDRYQLRGRRIHVHADLRFRPLSHELFVVIGSTGEIVKGGENDEVCAQGRACLCVIRRCRYSGTIPGSSSATDAASPWPPRSGTASMTRRIWANESSTTASRSAPSSSMIGIMQ